MSFLTYYEFFEDDPFHIAIYRHKLHGNMLGLESIGFINSDLRIIFKETKDSYIFLAVGTHNQVYNN